MLIVLQHNVAHLGIVTGLFVRGCYSIYPKMGITSYPWDSCISFYIYFVGWDSWEPLHWKCYLISYNLGAKWPRLSFLLYLFAIPIKDRTFYYCFCICYRFRLLWVVSCGYRLAVSCARLVTPCHSEREPAYLYECAWAVVMPHNLFLHSEVIQSHEYNKQDDASIRKVLKWIIRYTFSMIVGWAINSAMILLLLLLSLKSGIQVGKVAIGKIVIRTFCWGVIYYVFALALLMAGVSSITSGMTAGYFCEDLWGWIISYKG